MKKLICIISLAVMCFVAHAQVPGFSIGPKIGYNSNNLSFDKDSISSGLQNAFQAGVFLRLGDKVYVQPEANYQVKGGFFEKSSGSRTFNEEIRLKTLSVPVLLGFRLVDAKIFNLRVMAGPTMAFVIDKELKPDDSETVWPINSVDDIRNSAWSAQLGAGVDVWHFTLDVRYEFGIDNLYTGSSELNLKNNIFNVSLGFKLL